MSSDLVSENARLRDALKRMLFLFSEKDGALIASRTECLGAISSAALVWLDPVISEHAKDRDPPGGRTDE